MSSYICRWTVCREHTVHQWFKRGCSVRHSHYGDTLRAFHGGAVLDKRVNIVN